MSWKLHKVWFAPFRTIFFCNMIKKLNHIPMKDRAIKTVQVKVRYSQCFRAFLGALICMCVHYSFAEDTLKSALGVSSGDPIEFINRAMEQGWSDYSLKPSKVEDDAKWMRRAYLDVIGRVPRLDEQEEFLRARSKSKRADLVDRLLHDSQYTREFADYWSTVWSNLLIGRTGGNTRNSLVHREGMASYLRESFASGKAYDVMVHELVTAVGTTKPGTEGFNGATNFLADKVNDENATLATSATARIFLGMQVQCTQCHNHPFNQWRQDKFWQLNAFFRQTRALRRFVPDTNDIDHIQLVDEDFPGEGRDARPEEAVVFYEERNGVLRSAFPVFLDGTEIDRNGYVSQVNRRSELGNLIVQNEYLSKMMVNRTWAHFLGYGFTRPMDDLGPHNSVSHPELLEYLAAEFVKAKYDVRTLIRWIVLSQPYQLSSLITERNKNDDPSIGEVPQFSHFYMRQMSAEQLYQSLMTVGGQARGSAEEQQAERDRWLSQFVLAFGTDEGDEATTFNGSIPQALMMFNGELVQRAVETGPDTFIGNLAVANIKLNDKVNRLFLTGLSRRATSKEWEQAMRLLAARQGRTDEALQDLWWAILNSNEFILIH